MRTSATRVSSVVAALSVAILTAGAAGGIDVNVDPDPVVQNEISLALVPGQTAGAPSLLFMAYNDNPYPGGNGLGVSHSFDGGASWNNAQLQFPMSSASGNVLPHAFDPTVTVDSQGNVYAGHISTDGGGGGESGLYVHKGVPQMDGTIAWSAPTEVWVDPPSTTGAPDPSYRFNDRCQITTDPANDNLYVTWIRDRGLFVQNPGTLPYSDVYFSASTDGGATFSQPPLQVNDVGTSDLANMPIPRVAPDGTIYVTWMDYNVWTGGQGTIYLDKSSDGGVTWLANDQAVATVPLPPLNVTTANGVTDALAKGAPVPAVSPSNSQELYIVYAADPDAGVNGPDEADIFPIKSTDGGTTWGAPIRVNDDATVNDQILPWVDVKPDGTIDVMWYDRRNDVRDTGGDEYWDVFIARSVDAGASFLPNVQINDMPFLTPVGQSWMGEYLGLAIDGQYAYGAWTSSVSDGNGDIYFDKIANVNIPEPGLLSIMAVATAALLRRRW